MKKNLLLTAILVLCTALAAVAGPAYPGRITVTQPDGTSLGIYLHGDEFGHWATDEAGNILEQDEKGYWSVSGALKRSSLTPIEQQAALRRAAANEMYRASAGSSANFGSPRIPVILIGFDGQAFSKTNAEFQAMLSEPGYSVNNAIGSVWDYFNDNSFGAFTPQFEVLGPVTLDNNISYYGQNSGGEDLRPELALVHAAQQLDESVDFSRYDNDGDGFVEFVIFYYAGYDEARGASASSIWSHAWALSNSTYISTSDQQNVSDDRTFDGVKLEKYFCTSELSGTSGSTMCAIGTTCHEFAHTLGLPDFYDTNGSTNGSAANMYSLDIMASGNYNVNSTTPPYFNAEELTEIGWLSAIPELSIAGSYTLQPVNRPGASSYYAYMTKTSVANEYFVYETRSGQRWDAGIPTGLMVYHVDKSKNSVSGNTASALWGANMLNAYSAHPCCYVVPAAKPDQTTLYSGSAYMFGSLYKTFTPTEWKGETTGFSLQDITYSSADKTVTFTFTNSNTLGVTGTVMDSDGNPISGATVTLTPGSGVSNAPSKVVSSIRNTFRMLLRPAKKNRSSAARASSSYTATTGSDGTYMIEAPLGTYQVSVSANGYISQSSTVDITSRIETVLFYLLREGEELPSVIYAWPIGILSDEDEYIAGTDGTSLTAQNLYPSSEMSRYAGKQIKELTFYLYGESSTTYRGVNVIIDYDNDRKATVSVSSPTIGGYTTVDLRELELIIPSNKDVYAGVGFSRGGYSYNGAYYSFGAFYKTDDDGVTYDWAVGWPYDGLVSSYSLTSTGERTSWDVIFDFTLTVGDYEAPDTGYNYIADPGNGSYSHGDVFNLTLIETAGVRKPSGAISWYYDDEPVSGQTVTLTSGTHVIEARFTTSNGETKSVELEVDVR